MCWWSRSWIASARWKLSASQSAGCSAWSAAVWLPLFARVTEHGRRKLVKVAEHLATLREMIAILQSGQTLHQVARTLTGRGLLSQRGRPWHRRTVTLILAREGCHTPLKLPRIEKVCDINVSAARARELNAQGYSLRQIAERLTKERHIPQRAAAWHAATVMALLRPM